jgi:hypothetical protein
MIMSEDQFSDVLGQGRGPMNDMELLRERIHELECELADERAEPRPGEDFRLEAGGMGPSGISYFAEDRKTKVLVNAKGREDKSVRRTAMYHLREALSPENINLGWPSKGSIHASICSCSACGHGGLIPEDLEQED